MLERLRPDYAVLACAGIPNLDGDPFPGPIEEFAASEAALLGWPTVVPCHHDDWMPPLTGDGVDRESILLAMFANRTASALVLPRYGRSIELQPRADIAPRPPADIVGCPICGQQVRSLFVSTEVDGSHARMFCRACAVRPELAVRVQDGRARFVSSSGAAKWAFERMHRHALANESPEDNTGLPSALR